jgi:pimeloyl-ACP methyl ester carboxylesterase
MSRVFESLGSIEGAFFSSESESLIGTIYIGLGEGKKPTVILLHGLPGLEKNVDIAYALREMGWNVLLPHYRGCWGSEGRYRFSGIPIDVKNALTYMQSKPYVDKDRVFLVGHSMGAWASIITTAQDKRVRAAIAISGGAMTSMTSDRQKNYLGSLINQGFLKGISLEEALNDWARIGKELAPQDWVGEISPRPLLLIGGEKDAAVSPDSVKAVFEKAKEPKTIIIVNDADHVFTKKRKELVQVVTDWLRTQT